MARQSENELQHKPSPALRQNKRRLEAAQSKFTDIRKNGLTRERPARGEGAGRSLTGKESDFDLVSGKAGRAVTSKVRDEDRVARHVERKGQGRSDSRPSTLHIPIARPMRQSTDDGRTSFHFSHDAIAKTRNAVVNDAGRVNRPGAAKAHNRYIERDSAVAVNDDGIELELTNDVEKQTKLEAEAPVLGNDNDGIAVQPQELYFDQPLNRNFLRTYRSTLATLFTDPEPDPRGGPADDIDRVRDVSHGGLVPAGRFAEMLLRADEVSALGREGEGSGPSVRREGDENRGDPGKGRSRLAPVPARLSLSQKQDVQKAVEVLGDKAPANDVSTAEGQGKYIERQEALALQPDGKRVLFTNIDEDADKRAEFWRLVEEHEREPDPDKISFTIAANPDFWNRVSAHPDCPANLTETISAAHPFTEVTMQSDDNVALRRFLTSIEGWPDTGPRRKDEANEEYNARQSLAPCKFHDGRGGRVQYRIIGELPHELNGDQRTSILREFTEEFEKRKLPFVAVMHAPDHTNNDKNWHFHLVYYDRPCSRLSEDRIRAHFSNLDPSSKLSRDEVKIGQWDFTAIEAKRDKWRNKWTDRPFAQPKVKEVSRHQDWVVRLRKRLADITNDHLELAGVERRVDARRHNEMGIHGETQDHLGTRLANLEAMGIATAKGVSNEERQWAAIQKKLDGDLARRKSVVDQTAERWIKQAERSKDIAPAAKAEIRGHVTRWHQHRTEAEEHLAIAENLDQHTDRLLSRANKVRETCQKQLDAIDAGKATKYQASRAEQLTRKSAEAVEWLTDTAEILKEENKLSKECRSHAEQERLVADRIELTIERALLSGGGLQVAVEERRRKDEEAERQREAARRREDAERDQTERRRALVKEEMDAWIELIRKGHRRLVQQGKHIVPANMTPEDQTIVSAINYPAMSKRLAGIKRAQDTVIADTVKAIQGDPRNVIQQRTAQGTSYVLITSNRTLAQAFKTYADDPAIIKARDDAIARNAEDAARRTEDRRIAAAAREENERAGAQPSTAPQPTREPAREPIPSERNRQSEKPAHEQTPRDADGPSASPAKQAPAHHAQAAARQVVNERIVRAVREEARRVLVEDGIATLSRRHLEAVGATSEDLADPALQKRLLGLAAVQERELKRLTAYAKAHPNRLIEREGSMIVSAEAPREIVEISRRWQNDDTIGLALHVIRDEYDQKSQKTKSTPEPRHEDPAPNDEKRGTPGQAESAPREPVRPAATPQPEEPQRPRFTKLTPDYELRAEAKAYAEEQERRRKQAQEQAERAPLGKEERTGEDPVARVVRIAAEKAATTGTHPLIDEWVQAVKDGMSVSDRRLIALRITNEREAREKLRDIDRNVARRIREDADQARDEMQPGLGLDRDRGVTPKR